MADYPDWQGAEAVFLVLDPGTGNPIRLRSEAGAIAVIPLESQLIDIQSGQLNVSTLTPVFAFRDLSAYRMVVFEGWTDSSDQITFLVEKSPDAAHAGVATQTDVITSGKSVSIEVQTVLTQYWRLSAYTDSPGFPTSVLKWKLRGLPRVL